ncbi:epidermal growth factor-like protein 7 [Aplochiton taeniatus]
MYQTLLLSSSLFILHVTATLQFGGHHGRRVCGSERRHISVVTATESYIQPVHKPYITLCQGHRLCSTYKTVYRTSTRQVSRSVPVSHSYPECCPGWRRLHSQNCNQAVCGQACVNGGTCVRPNHCTCPLGWMGHQCQTDVDECSEQPPCSQECVNTAGSYLCACREGFRLASDGCSCEKHLPLSATPAPLPPTVPTQSSQRVADGHRSQPGSEVLCVCMLYPGGGLAENVTEEVQSLRSRVELLEQKLQLVLAPFNSLYPLSLDEGVSEKTTFLSHSFQQLDRIDSLSEQIGFLEERIGTCSCQEN